MDQIRVIGDAETLRWVERWITNERQAPVRLLQRAHVKRFTGPGKKSMPVKRLDAEDATATS
jgi:hypothetical protein